MDVYRPNKSKVAIRVPLNVGFNAISPNVLRTRKHEINASLRRVGEGRTEM